MIKFPSTIFEYVKREEVNYENPIPIFDGYEWGMRTHLKESLCYKLSQFIDGNPNHLKPFKNIVRPILNLQYRTEGFDVKDIELYVDEAKNYFKSFLIRKYHERWARQEGIDTFIDELVESYVDFGGALIKDVNGARPEVVPLQSIAFCDQTDMLSGPIGFKHFFSPSELKKMEKRGWKQIDELITLANFSKKNAPTESKTTGKYVEVYEVHGDFPESYLDDKKNDEDYETQIHIVAFYYNEDGKKNGITLFSSKEKALPFKLIKRDPVRGRALGFGGVEELFDPQLWTNYSEVQKKNMLDAASKIIHITTDELFFQRFKPRNMENNEVAFLGEGKDVKQLDTFPRNIGLFEKSLTEWENHAQRMASATDPLLGESPTSGTPFRLQERVVIEGKGIHDYRRGKIATFMDEIYRDWIIPKLAKNIVTEQEFLASLDLDELQEIADALVTCEANKLIKDRVLSAQVVRPEEVDDFKNKVREAFMKGGNKRFLKILEGEFKGVSLDVKTNIAGKQKYLAQQVDKLTNVFRTIVSAPQVLDDPRMSKLFNEILEGSGLSPIDFGGSYAKPQMPQQQMPQLPINRPEALPVPA